MLSASTLQMALDFRRAQEWEQFHTPPKNLAIAISVEAAELLEQFQWMLTSDARPSDVKGISIEHEVADIAILLAYLANDLNVNIDEVVKRKLSLNAQRYPIEKARGTATKYDKL
ncbi:MAG: nucleotide pyrophosphohydrolase [Gemmatimonas sp.]